MGYQAGSSADQLLVHGDGASVRTGGLASESPPSRFGRGEVLVALAAFAVVCVAALARAAQLLEPDDLAYRASILALTHGHLLSLTNAEYQALLKQLSSSGGQGIAQWVQTSGGTWISEKNPGYPFLAAPFQALGLHLGSGSLLQLGGGTGLRLATHDANLHRRVADRGRRGSAAVGAARHGTDGAQAHHHRAAWFPGTGGRSPGPVHQRRPAGRCGPRGTSGVPPSGASAPCS